MLMMDVRQGHLREMGRWLTWHFPTLLCTCPLARTNSLILRCVRVRVGGGLTWYDEKHQFRRWRSSSDADGSTSEKLSMLTLSLPHYILGIEPKFDCNLHNMRSKPSVLNHYLTVS